jgi:hypothetical protein
MVKNKKVTSRLYTDADAVKALKDLKESKRKIKELIRQVKSLKVTIFSIY